MREFDANDLLTVFGVDIAKHFNDEDKYKEIISYLPEDTTVIPLHLVGIAMEITKKRR